MGSYNSFPHFRNIESHLNALIAAHEDAGGGGILNSLETYLLLSAVLFHDIGRTRPDAVEEHPWVSKRLIETRYSELGIPSKEIALSLARICVYHDPGKGRARETRNQLNQTASIEPYGTADELKVGTLLSLADHMDATFRRTVPRCIERSEDIGAIGAFRRVVTGVSYDPLGSLIKTTIRSLSNEGNLADVFLRVVDGPGLRELIDVELLGTPISEERSGVFWDEVTPENLNGFSRAEDTGAQHLLELFGVPRDRIQHMFYMLMMKGYGFAFKNDARDLVSGIPKGAHAFDAITAEVRKKLSNGKSPSGELNRRKQILRRLNEVMATRIGWKDDYIQEDKQDPQFERDRYLVDQLLHNLYEERWPNDTLVAAVLSDVRNNANFLKSIADDLKRYGINADAWLVELDGHLYNTEGWETHEPVFNKELLRSAIKAMWNLSIEVFGVPTFTYEAVANALQIREFDLARLAVERIEKVGGGALRLRGVGWHWADPDITWQELNDYVNKLEEPK